jgi:Fe2+ or Zn2+ uptake regulation protein
MEIYIKTRTGRTITVQTDLQDTIQQILDKIERQEGFRADQYRLKFGGNILENNKRLGDYNVFKDQSFQLFPRTV